MGFLMRFGEGVDVFTHIREKNFITRNSSQILLDSGPGENDILIMLVVDEWDIDGVEVGWEELE